MLRLDLALHFQSDATIQAQTEMRNSSLTRCWTLTPELCGEFTQGPHTADGCYERKVHGAVISTFARLHFMYLFVRPFLFCVDIASFSLQGNRRSHFAAVYFFATVILAGTTADQLYGQFGRQLASLKLTNPQWPFNLHRQLIKPMSSPFFFFFGLKKEKEKKFVLSPFGWWMINSLNNCISFNGYRPEMPVKQSSEYSHFTNGRLKSSSAYFPWSMTLKYSSLKVPGIKAYILQPVLIHLAPWLFFSSIKTKQKKRQKTENAPQI